MSLTALKSLRSMQHERERTARALGARDLLAQPVLERAVVQAARERVERRRPLGGGVVGGVAPGDRGELGEGDEQLDVLALDPARPW